MAAQTRAQSRVDSAARIASAGASTHPSQTEIEGLIARLLANRSERARPGEAGIPDVEGVAEAVGLLVRGLEVRLDALDSEAARDALRQAAAYVISCATRGEDEAP